MLAWHMSISAFPPPTGAGTPRLAPDARFAALTASLTARLGGVCRGWDAAEFQALVTQIARTQLRWADRDGHA